MEHLFTPSLSQRRRYIFRVSLLHQRHFVSFRFRLILLLGLGCLLAIKAMPAEDEGDGEKAEEEGEEEGGEEDEEDGDGESIGGQFLSVNS